MQMKMRNIYAVAQEIMINYIVKSSAFSYILYIHNYTYTHAIFHYYYINQI